jgi:hypothetical protein
VSTREERAVKVAVESALQDAAEIASRAGKYRIANLILDMMKDGGKYEELLRKASDLLEEENNLKVAEAAK